jgi:hypothetical protein
MYGYAQFTFALSFLFPDCSQMLAQKLQLLQPPKAKL